MSILNQGRNEIRFNNSDGKCLLENWVEERAVKNYDTVRDVKTSGGSKAELFKDGHAGVLTINLEAKPENETTVRASYKTPVHPGIPLEGNKSKLMRQMYMEKAVQEVFVDDINPPQPEPLDYKSVTAKDFFNDDFVHVPPKPTKNHNYRTEQPVTFWSEHKGKVTGVSSVKTGDTPFRRNDAFSQPIDEYFDDTQPYDQENYPKM
ncbi:sperm-associated antigen 8-like [Ruditapes philippinarum]|uniref:sperm-associated antigen 8-like n=1 Tax=Ruditapes philippinarum TaxID=129788 RepID=UPI00295BB33E|nr:sperm-associated antigen 8-like [Ruditapes philippinarum]